MKDSINRDKNICIIVFPFKSPSFECGQRYLTIHIEILSQVVENITVIAGNYFPKTIPQNVQIINVKTPIIADQNESIISRFFRLFFGQLFLTRELILNRRKFDIVHLYMWTGAIFLPSLITHFFLRKKLFLMITGSPSKSSKSIFISFSKLFSVFILFIEETNYLLAEKIFIGGSENMISDLNLERYRNKIVTNTPDSFIDTNKFYITKKLDERKNIVGYVGRLSYEKGILELIESIPIILKKKPEIIFYIIGDGPAMEFCKLYIKEKQCEDNVIFFGWIDHSQLNDYFNRMKLHILPSNTEALGGTSLEAMASGVISLVSPAGGLKDTIIDGYNGFILDNNHPSTIAKKVLEIMEMDNLEKIQITSREYVVSNFSYDNIIRKFKNAYGV